MIIVLRDADFSANNVGKITIPGSNLNIGEGTNNPLLFKYSNTTGSGEFLGVDFVTKENPSVFPVIRKLHKGGSGSFLYSFLTADRSTIDFPTTPSNLSMAIWINKSAWEQFQSDSLMFVVLQVYNNGWKDFNNGGGTDNPLLIKYDQLVSAKEFSQNFTAEYFSCSVKRKVLDTEVVNGETWVCVGIVFANIQFNTATYEANCRPRIAMLYSFMNTTEHDMEVGNLQVVESSDYLSPDQEY